MPFKKPLMLFFFSFTNYDNLFYEIQQFSKLNEMYNQIVTQRNFMFE